MICASCRVFEFDVYPHIQYTARRTAVVSIPKSGVDVLVHVNVVARISTIWKGERKHLSLSSFKQRITIVETRTSFSIRHGNFIQVSNVTHQLRSTNMVLHNIHNTARSCDKSEQGRLSVLVQPVPH